MKIAVSIIIPTLNEALGIECCLKNLQPLREQGVEVIVSDGGSTDNTRELAILYADKVIEADLGRASQMNAGALLANGEFLLFLHSDTSLPTGFSEAWLTGLTWGFFPVKLSGVAWPFRLVERAINIRSRFSGIGTGDQALFIRRTLFESIGGFANIPLMEDVELCRRLKADSCPVVQNNPVTTSSRRWEQKGIIRTVVQMWRLRLAYLLGVPPRNLVKQYYP